MTKLLAITLAAIALSACSSWDHDNSMGNRAETKNSTDANKSGNRAAASPGTGTGASSGMGAGAGSAGAGAGAGSGSGSAGSPAK